MTAKNECLLPKNSSAFLPATNSEKAHWSHSQYRFLASVLSGWKLRELLTAKKAHLIEKRSLDRISVDRKSCFSLDQNFFCHF